MISAAWGHELPELAARGRKSAGAPARGRPRSRAPPAERGSAARRRRGAVRAGATPPAAARVPRTVTAAGSTPPARVRAVLSHARMRIAARTPQPRLEDRRQLPPLPPPRAHRTSSSPFVGGPPYTSPDVRRQREIWPRSAQPVRLPRKRKVPPSAERAQRIQRPLSGGPVARGGAAARTHARPRYDSASRSASPLPRAARDGAW